MSDGHHSKVGQSALVLGALGVVYGDIGTSPLYAFREAFTEQTHVLDGRPHQRVRRLLARVLGADHHHLDQVPRAS